MFTLIASARARLLAATACLAARSERAPRAIGRCETRVAAVAVDVKPFASRVVKLAALAKVVGRVPGARARLLCVSAQEALVLRVRARVGHDGTASRVHMARGRILRAEARGRSNNGKSNDTKLTHRKRSVVIKVNCCSLRPHRVRPAAPGRSSNL